MLQQLVLSILLQPAASLSVDETAENVVLPEIHVYSRRENPPATPPASLSALSSEVLDNLSAAHPNEIFNQVPGAWLVHGSGQEHLTAIRSPVLTGAGACGAFLVLEDRVPTRPAGFCNVNQLFEVNLLQASRVDVLRGPGNVIHGSNALHGSIDVSSRQPGRLPAASVAFEAGTDDYYRGRFSVSSENLAVYGNFTDAGSFRDDENYQHGFLNAVWETDIGHYQVRTVLSYADLDQDTAGFILGKDAYEDPLLRRQNLNPEAFRNADATRLSSQWKWQSSSGAGIEIIPFIRSSNMLFLQHFLPGTPLEDNSQDSAGLLFAWYGTDGLSAGVDLEWAEGELFEFQRDPVTSGSEFLNETRPQGAHYDYEAVATALAGWLSYDHALSDRLDLTAGLRFEHLEYDYDNRMLDGNTRDDGSECGFGGCLYTRPADRTDSFTNLAPELGLNWAWRNDTDIYARLSRGFRAPQATELYRLQRGQEVADLESEELNALEVGLRHTRGSLQLDIAAWAMRKRNFIFRDADGFNVSDGRTRHVGVESSLDWQAHEKININANLSWARHEYDFDRNLGRGEIITRGNEVDTAPRWLAGTRVLWAPTDPLQAELEWVYQGSHYLDAANLHRYEGHHLLNLRINYTPPGSRHHAALRMTNLLDERYAERADFAFGNYRYFPGAGRRFVLEWGLSWQ